MSQKKSDKMPKTTAQQLASIIKSCRDIMRKDKGLSGDLDRLPMLTWIMFLKFLDDMEKIRETDALLHSERYVPAVETPYRWRDWAAKEGGITGDEFIAFINNDEAVRPDGTRGPGLFAYLRSLQGGDGGDRRDVIATVFRGTINRMINGYLLRDTVNKINSINFTSTEEIHTLSHLYESMLKEMRDAAGDSGEFYTPRPVVRFIVEVIDPQLGEKILDPACGTGGFLTETYEHLLKLVNTTRDREILQRESIYGGEAKPLPYLLGQMNLLLHGLEYPQIDPENSLRFNLREIGEKDRVDVIMTNPPFGGEEERGILGNFPEDKQTSETALLFLQLIMRRLKRPIEGNRGGRCGMVVPNGTLFGTGVAERIKKELLESYNLHTIVRLPKGVFAPYTDIETNLLFFARDGPTKEIWYYEVPLPEGRKQYTKTKPMKFEEFRTVLDWWNSRRDNEHAWKASADDVAENNYNLDIKNPNKAKAEEYRAPEEIATSVIEKEKRIFELMEEIQDQINKGLDYGE
jgi:type I restriction enzyme M protein